MIQYSFRFIKRFAILIPGLIIAYFSVFNIFPYFEDRLPLAIAIIATYALGAYILIPAAIRIIRSIYPTKHLPLYCVTPDGFASDPLNIGIVGSRKDLISSMEVAGWHTTDRSTFLPLIKQMLALLINNSYETAPVSNLYLFGRPQDIAFEKAVVGKRSERHHVRFWATTFEGSFPTSRETIHWYRKQPPDQSQNVLWVGAASLDAGIALIRHNLQISHMINPDTNKERELIETDLRSTKKVKDSTSVRLGKAYKLTNRVWRGYLLSDGKMTVIRLR